MSALLAEALRLAGKGRRVLPLRAGAKVPLLAHGVLDATSDREQVEAWWRRWPDANLGHAMGDGVAVVDVDHRHGGSVTLANLSQAEPLPAWPTVATGGGFHHYVAVPPGTAGRMIGAGVELKASGSYAVSPPSRHPSGRYYVWLDRCSPPVAPSWALPPTDSSRRQARPASEWGALFARGALEGERNATVTRAAGYLLARGLSSVAVLELLTAWNAKRLRPPLPDAEIRRVVDSVCRCEARKGCR